MRSEHHRKRGVEMARYEAEGVLLVQIFSGLHHFITSSLHHPARQRSDERMGRVFSFGPWTTDCGPFLLT